MQRSRVGVGNSFSRLVALVFIVLGLAPFARVQAQLPEQVEKMAAAITLTTELLDKLDAFAKTVGGDPAIRAQMAASEKDPDFTAEKFGEVINSKYPKLAAAFKSAGLTPDDFMKVNGTLAATAGAVELANAGMNTGTDKTVQANIAFFKANTDRCKATMSALENLVKPSK